MTVRIVGAVVCQLVSKCTGPCEDDLEGRLRACKALA